MSELEDKDVYIAYLEERVATLTKSNTSLRKQLEAFRRQASRDYSSREDYIPYPEHDRD
jgi:hypothetical protein